MNNLAIFFLLFFSVGYSQNQKAIFFKTDNSFNTDSIVFHNKKLGNINDVLKFKKSKKIKFSVYKDGEKYNFNVAGNSLGFINVLSLIPTLDNKTSLLIDRSHTLISSTIDDQCMKGCFELKIKTYNIWNNNGKFETGSEELDKEINDNFIFFTSFN